MFQISYTCILYRQSFLAFVTKRSFVIKQSNKFLIPLDIRPKITSTRDRTFRCVRREREREIPNGAFQFTALMNFSTEHTFPLSLRRFIE